VARLLQLVAAARGAAVLPHDRPVERLAALAVPRDHRLALVRDPYARERTAVDARGVECLLCDGARHVPDLARVVLHPARAREVLLELAVGAPDRAAALVERDARGPGGALVDREDQGRGASTGRRPVRSEVIPAAYPAGIVPAHA
jgi:hypothetical protein